MNMSCGPGAKLVPFSAKRGIISGNASISAQGDSCTGPSRPPALPGSAGPEETARDVPNSASSDISVERTSLSNAEFKTFASGSVVQPSPMKFWNPPTHIASSDDLARRRMSADRESAFVVPLNRSARLPSW